MAKLLKLRRGTTSQHSSFTGAEGEVTVDTDKEALVVHNGSTAGGFPVARADGTGVTNFTITGELDAATLDISGNADVDGTLEADAYTVNGTALNEYIADTVGAMVTGNTETGIAVTYEDGDNTLDFVVGTLNQNTTGTAANLSGTPDITVGVVTAGSLDISGNADIDGTLEADAYTVNGTALDTHIAGVTVTNATNAVTATNANHVSVADNESTNENNKIVFIEDASATGNVGLESDGDFHYNPSTGLLTTPAISTSGNITIAGNLTVNGTTTTVATTNTTVTDNLLELNSGAGSNANDAGILIERGSTGDNAIIAWDESADRFTLGTTTATNDATGNISVSTGTLAANIVGNVTGNVTGNTSGSSGSCTGNAAGLTGSPNITVGTISAGITTGTEFKLADNEVIRWGSSDTATIQGADGASGYLKFNAANALRATINADGVSDAKGNLRSIPQQNEQGSAHTLVAADSGKHILADATVTVPPTSGIFSAGDAITIINTSGSDISIARGSGVTMHNSADGTNADRTLSTKGMATLLCAGSNTYYISGAGLS